VSGAVVGWGHHLPERVVSNAELEARLDTSDAWIVERTGIRERRLGGETGTMAVEAGRMALERAGVLPRDVGLTVLATTTPDKEVPATSSDVHYRLGLGGGAFDLNAACAGFVYALVVASSMTGYGVERALVIGSDALNLVVDPDDRSTAILFADGAGALLLEAVPGEDPLLSWDLGVDGSALPLIYCERGGRLYMEGQEVFRRAVRVMVDSATNALERAKLGPEDVALLVPHQANLRIIEAANKRLGIEMERTALCIGHSGNTSSASIPIALSEAAEQGRLAPGDKVLLSGFGAGLTWASAVLRWGP
jgi:3-oxoacyl-[acyl-carrier-protein] synthase-3